MEVNKIYCGKMEIVLKDFEDNICDSIVTDPPYGLKFMGKHWDYGVPSVEQWEEAFRVLKPGGYLLCACGTRTQHRMAVNIEDAGFEIRDVITWHYGSGFPKSLNISIAIDKKAGVLSNRGKAFQTAGVGDREDIQGTTGAESFETHVGITNEAKQWEGWGTALKPATEFWTLARKPISEKTIAENVLKYGTGGINIDECRIATDEKLSIGSNNRNNGSINFGMKDNKEAQEQNYLGRFPANVILDEFMADELDKQSGVSISKAAPRGGTSPAPMSWGDKRSDGDNIAGFDDVGGASRFFYTAKSDSFERNKGLKNFDKTSINHIASESGGGGGWKTDAGKNPNLPRANHHPTVKPIDLMRYLVKLITPKGGIVLDPFNGSGTTGIAAKLELMKYVGIEMDEEYVKISEARISAWNPDKYKPQQLF